MQTPPKVFFVSIHKIISDLFSINPYFEETVTQCSVLLTLYKNVLLAQSDKSCFLYNFSRVIALFFCSDANSKVKRCILQLFECTPDHDTTHIDIFFLGYSLLQLVLCLFSTLVSVVFEEKISKELSFYSFLFVASIPQIFFFCTGHMVMNLSQKVFDNSFKNKNFFLNKSKCCKRSEIFILSHSFINFTLAVEIHNLDMTLLY